MAEETKTTRGRKPKTQVDNNIDNNEVDMAKMIAEMQLQMEQMRKQLEESKSQAESSNKEKTELQQLVEALQSNSSNDKPLPKKVKVMSLITNKYNLTTEPNGQGKQFTFDEFGDVVTMKTTELEEILSIQKQRTQAEEGWFYILDKDIVEDQELTDSYENISNKETLEHVIKLDSDNCVDIFCGLGKEMQDSLATKMAELILDGVRLDRNRISDISMRADIDIEEIAKSIERTKPKNK